MKPLASFSWGALVLAALLTPGLSFGAEPSGISFTERYWSPFSMGIGYQSVTSLGSSGALYDTYGLNGIFRLSFQAFPALQPALRLGLTQSTAREIGSPWSHTDYYGLLGAVWAHRLSKTFEVGAELTAGPSVSVFPDILGGTESGLNANIAANAGAFFAMAPSYNFELAFTPALRWQKALGALTDYDGFTLGLGITAQFRLGEDPDSARAEPRFLRFSDLPSAAVFPAMQSWYVKNPLGSVTITNTDRLPLRDVQVSFYQKGYMDAPTVCAVIPELKAGESKTVGLLASFNQEVFRTEGVIPLTGEISVTYETRNRSASQTQSLSYDLQDKSAILWDDDRKAAAFITPSDSALRNYASYIRQACKTQAVPGLSESVQFACELYYALSELGILYQSDPVTPFSVSRETAMAVDSVSLPRDTLKRITGDCDDLTVLFASLLEAAGYESGFITVPGHIYAAVNTKVAAAQYADLNPDRAMSINLDGELWIPVEVTMLGREGFLEAWRRGMAEWAECEERPADRALYTTASAQALYRPVSLREADLGLQYGSAAAVASNFSRDAKKLVDGIIAYYTASSKKDSPADLNRLGLRLARYGFPDKALPVLKQAVKLDGESPNPLINLGNVFYVSKDYDQALSHYRLAETRLAEQAAADPASPAAARLDGVRSNISRCLASMGKADDAKGSPTALAAAPGSSSGADMAKAAGESAKAASADTPLYFAE